MWKRSGSSLLATGLAACLVQSSIWAGDAKVLKEPVVAAASSLHRDISPRRVEGMLRAVAEDMHLAPGDVPRVEVLPDYELDRRAHALLRAQGQRVNLFERNASLKRIGLLLPGDDLSIDLMVDLPSSVGGLYDPVSESIFIRESLPGENQDEVIYHELVHLLQHRHYRDVREKVGNHLDEDHARAVRAVMEGHAVSVATHLTGIERQGTRLRSFFGRTSQVPEVLALVDFEDQTTVPVIPHLSGSRLFSLGARFVEVFERFYGENLASLYESPPISTEQLLHFKRYAQGEKPADATIANLGDRLSGDWDICDVFTMGEFNTALWLGREPGSDGALGWNGDQLISFRSAKGKHITGWRTLWDTDADAVEFFESAQERFERRFGRGSRQEIVGGGVFYVQGGEGFGLVRNGREVRILAGADALVLPDLLMGSW